jgi:pimeloyl-ACP methyl ester carboxylesterase
MAYSFKLPDLGEGISEGRVVEWLVSEGDAVKEDDPLVEVETDKAVVVIPSPHTGTVTSLKYAEGDVATVDSVLVIFDGTGDDDEGASEAEEPKPKAKKAKRPAAPARVRMGAGASALPGTRRIARNLGVDLDALTGTGPDGRITDLDVVATSGAGALHVESGGEGEPLLVLLHGMGGTASLWEPLLDIVRENWPGRWIAPDLRGHGRSPRSESYSVGEQASDVAALIGPGAETIVVGHSLGTAVAALLATGWFGVPPAAVVALSLKENWSEQELKYMRSVSGGSQQTFATEAEAVASYLKFCGLSSEGADPRLSVGGVRQADAGWVTTFDPRAARLAENAVTFAPGLVKAPLLTAVGSDDPLIGAEGVADAVANGAEAIPGAGHNVHVERPDEVWRLIEKARDEHLPG